MILIRVDYWDIKTNSILDTTGKYYAGDLGLLTSIVGENDSTTAYKIENVVLLQLIAKGWEVYTLKIYQKPSKKKTKEEQDKDNEKWEIDFVIKKGPTIKYIQVTHTLTEKNKNREIGNLLKIKDAHEKICLLLVDETKFTNDGVKRINLLEWLIEDRDL
jgi:predicted AAA+ superfamily ATPase